MFDKQCWKGAQTIKHCLTSKSKHNLSRDVFEKVQKHFVLDAMKKMLDEQCFWTWPNGHTKFQVGPTMFDRLVTA